MVIVRKASNIKKIPLLFLNKLKTYLFKKYFNVKFPINSIPILF